MVHKKVGRVSQVNILGFTTGLVWPFSIIKPVFCKCRACAIDFAMAEIDALSKS